MHSSLLHCLIACVSSAGLLLSARAQPADSPLNSQWHGRWQMQSSTVVTGPAPAPVPLTIRTDGGRTVLEIPGRSCALRYDGTLTIQALTARLRELRDWQLLAEHWPAGTQPRQLVGLQLEFERALSMAASVTPGAYRRVRASGPGCDSDHEDFMLLHNGQRLLRFRFPANGLGVEANVFVRA